MIIIIKKSGKWGRWWPVRVTPKTLGLGITNNNSKTSFLQYCMTHNDPLKKCSLRRNFIFIYLYFWWNSLQVFVSHYHVYLITVCCLKYLRFRLKTWMIQKVNKFHFGFMTSQEVTVTPVSRIQAADRRQLYYLASNLLKKPFNTSIYDLFPAEPVLNGTSRLSYQLF